MNTEKAMKGLLDFTSSLASGNPRPNRNTSMNTEINGQIVDTVIPGDTGKWETGIKRDGRWIIVEQYEDMKGATKGHTKWVEKLRKNSKCKLKDIDMWGLNED